MEDPPGTDAAPRAGQRRRRRDGAGGHGRGSTPARKTVEAAAAAAAEPARREAGGGWVGGGGRGGRSGGREGRNAGARRRGSSRRAAWSACPCLRPRLPFRLSASAVLWAQRGVVCWSCFADGGWPLPFRDIKKKSSHVGPSRRFHTARL